MFTLSSNITITDPTGTNYLDNLPLVEVKITKSRKTLTNTAKVTLPRRIKVLNGDINTIIKRGSAISIQIGYDGNLKTRFTGYVTGLSAEIPLTIHCQDTMWKLKQNSFTKTWPKGTKVADIVSYIYPGSAVVANLTIGGFVAKRESTALILGKLKKYGLQCYFATDAFDNNILYVDFAGAVHAGKHVDYTFYQNIIENRLEYKLKEDNLTQVIGISKQSNGQKIQLIAGDKGGEIHTLHYANLTQDQLQTIVNAEIAKLQYEGYKGNFKTFGLPEIEPGDIAVLNDPVYAEHDGSFLTEAVEITFGVNGYRHEPTLERKVS